MCRCGRTLASQHEILFHKLPVLGAMAQLGLDLMDMSNCNNYSWVVWHRQQPPKHFFDCVFKEFSMQP